MRIGIAADHGGFDLKKRLSRALLEAGHELVDFGADSLEPDDDYPDYVVPLARAVSQRQVERGIAVCGSGVGACVVANKVEGVRACLVHETYSAHQGVEDDNMNIICLGGRVVAYELAWELIQAFVSARYQAKERFQRRLDKVAALDRASGVGRGNRLS
jgi:ribose 5-phosphate isomerase B